MFIENEYKEMYDEIVKANLENIPEGTTEVHHIIPKSFFDTIAESNYPENLVRLSVEDHLKAHILLPYFTEGEQKDKMVNAIFGMINMGKRDFVDFETYTEIKEEFQKMQSKRMSDPNNYHPMRGKLGEDSPIFGIKRSEKTKAKMKKGKAEKVYTNSERKALSNAGKKGGKKAWENREILTCPHCGKEGEVANMRRWHFDKCKMQM